MRRRAHTTVELFYYNSSSTTLAINKRLIKRKSSFAKQIHIYVHLICARAHLGRHHRSLQNVYILAHFWSVNYIGTTAGKDNLVRARTLGIANKKKTHEETNRFATHFDAARAAYKNEANKREMRAARSYNKKEKMMSIAKDAKSTMVNARENFKPSEF